MVSFIRLIKQQCHTIILAALSLGHYIYCGHEKLATKPL